MKNAHVRDIRVIDMLVIKVSLAKVSLPLQLCIVYYSVGSVFLLGGTASIFLGTLPMCTCTSN